MKRWKIVLGRGGTTLITISLALLLVSVIPQPQSSTSSGSTLLEPEQVSVSLSQRNLTPQQEIQVTVTVEGTLKVYLLEMSNEIRFSPDDFQLNLGQIQDNNAKEFLEEHPDKILWEHTVVDGFFERSYSPTRVLNATVVFSNPSSEIAYVEFEAVMKSSLAPADKVQTIAYGAAPVGLLLALPWLLDLWKQRKHK